MKSLIVFLILGLFGIEVWANNICLNFLLKKNDNLVATESQLLSRHAYTNPLFDFNAREAVIPQRYLDVRPTRLNSTFNDAQSLRDNYNSARIKDLSNEDLSPKQNPSFEGNMLLSALAIQVKLGRSIHAVDFFENYLNALGKVVEFKSPNVKYVIYPDPDEFGPTVASSPDSEINTVLIILNSFITKPHFDKSTNILYIDIDTALSPDALSMAISKYAPLKEREIKPSSILGSSWIQKVTDPEIVNKIEFLEMTKISSGSIGLLSVNTKFFGYSFHLIHQDRQGNLIDHMPLHAGSRVMSERDWRKIVIETKQTYRNSVARKFAKAIDGKSGQIIISADYEIDPSKSRRFFAVSGNGMYLASFKNNLVEVQALNYSGGSSKMPLDSNGNSIWLDSVSEDGQRVIIIEQNLDNPNKTVTRILNISTGQQEFGVVTDVNGYPMIQFYEGGFTVLNPNGVSIYNNGRLTKAFNIPNSPENVLSGMTDINLPHGSFYNPQLDELLIFSHGPQPLKFSNNKLHEFEDVRPMRTQISVGDGLDALSADKFIGLSASSYSVSQNWKYAVQERQSGSGLDLSLKDSVILYGINGQYQGSVSPFWSVATSSLSPDGKFLAISEQFDGPTPTLGPKKRIWIYSTARLDIPVFSIDEIELWTIDRMIFSEDNSSLFVESVNSGKVIRYSLTTF